MPESLEIVVGGTPNPNAVKLTLNRTVATKGETYRLPAQSGAGQVGGDPSVIAAPWAQALLRIPGIVGVFGINNFISMNKTPEASWEAIIPKAQEALRQVWGTQPGG